MDFKNLTYISVIFLLMVNCSSDSTDDLLSDPTPTPTTVTYNDNIKSIMTNNCISCHGSSPTNGAPMPLTTYSQVKSAVETRGLIARINSTSNPMPPSSSNPLSNADKSLISKWETDGLLEN